MRCRTHCHANVTPNLQSLSPDEDHLVVVAVVRDRRRRSSARASGCCQGTTMLPRRLLCARCLHHRAPSTSHQPPPITPRRNCACPLRRKHFKLVMNDVMPVLCRSPSHTAVASPEYRACSITTPMSVRRSAGHMPMTVSASASGMALVWCTSTRRRKASHLEPSPPLWSRRPSSRCGSVKKLLCRGSFRTLLLCTPITSQGQLMCAIKRSSLNRSPSSKLSLTVTVVVKRSQLPVTSRSQPSTQVVMPAPTHCGKPPSFLVKSSSTSSLNPLDVAVPLPSPLILVLAVGGRSTTANSSAPGRFV